MVRRECNPAELLTPLLLVNFKSHICITEALSFTRNLNEVCSSLDPSPLPIMTATFITKETNLMGLFPEQVGSP